MQSYLTMAYTLKSLISASIFIVILIAASGLLGYLPGLKQLGSVREDYIPMAPSTAISFIIIGFALLTLSIKKLSSLKSAIYRIGVFLVAIFGLLEVTGYFIGVDINLEGSIIPNIGYLNGVRLAQMSPATGIGFFFSGVSVYLLILKKINRQSSIINEHINGWFGSITLIISFVFCIAYVYGTPLLYGKGTIVPMALSTAVGFLFLSFSILASDTNSFPIKYFIGTSTRSSLLRFILPLVILAVLLSNLLLLSFNQFSTINPALVTALSTIFMAIIAGVITIILSDKLATKIDRRAEERFRSVAENTSDLMWEVDANTVFTFCSDKVESVLGYSKDEIIGKTPFDFMEPDEAERVRKIFAEITRDNSSFRDLDTWHLTKDGRKVCMMMSGEAILDGGGNLLGYQGANSNITERKQMEARLEELAITDGLTRLYNRIYFDEKLEDEVQRSLRFKTPLSLLMLDIDYFKKVNDIHGHPAGDTSLVALAELMRGLSRTVDTCARYGGEEFVIILPNTPPDDSMVFAERLRQKVEALRVQYDDKLILFTISIGISALSLTKGNTAEELLNTVDLALYKSKDSGRNRVVTYSTHDIST